MNVTDGIKMRFYSSSGQNKRDFLPMVSIHLLGCEIEKNYMYFQVHVAPGEQSLTTQLGID